MAFREVGEDTVDTASFVTLLTVASAVVATTRLMMCGDQRQACDERYMNRRTRGGTECGLVDRCRWRASRLRAGLA